MRTEYIRESQAASLALSSQQASVLQALGTALASKKEWWGQTDSQPEQRSILRCTRTDDDKWEVTVSDAIGVISISGLQLIVEPKIPLRHFVHVVQYASSMPRLAPNAAALTKYRSFWDVIVAWYLACLQNALRGGLIRDYTETTETLPYIRGRTTYIDAARRHLRGVLEFECTFEDFQRDTPLNRVLKAATLRITRSSNTNATVRRILLLMDDVGELRPSDVRFEADRRSARYLDAFILGKHILANTGRTLLEGNEKAWTFLIRTPEIVEEGIRFLLKKHFGQGGVSKVGRKFGSLTLNPDLVFSTGNIADVKYKLNKGDWNRADFYEVIAFATAFGARRSAIINFCNTSAIPAEGVDVGPVKVMNICWDCVSFSEPEGAEAAFVRDIQEWNVQSVV